MSDDTQIEVSPEPVYRPPVRTPVHIQRAEINEPLADTAARLSNAVDFDYMGSSEFEWGALPKSFRRIEVKADEWKCRIVEDIKQGDTPLRVWSAFNDEEFAEYVKYLRILRAPTTDRSVERFYTKEAVRFESDYKHGKYSLTNFWWDIDNDVMFGFKKEFMKRVGHYVANSLAYMNEEKEKRGA